MYSFIIVLMHLWFSSFFWASTVTACNPRTHCIFLGFITLVLTKLFSFGQDLAFHRMYLAHVFKPGTIPSATNHDSVRCIHFSIMISSATHSQQLSSVVVFIVVLWLLFIVQCYSPHQSSSIINMQRLSLLDCFCCYLQSWQSILIEISKTTSRFIIFLTHSICSNLHALFVMVSCWWHRPSRPEHFWVL